MQWYADPGIVLNITKTEASEGSHVGDCYESITWLAKKPRIARQLAKLDPESVRECLRSYGAWDSWQLKDYRRNTLRLLWLACCDLRECNCC